MLLINGSEIDGIVSSNIADGSDISQGAKADIAVTDPTASASVIAALKGIIKQLQGDGSGATPVDITTALDRLLDSVTVYMAPDLTDGTYAGSVKIEDGWDVTQGAKADAVSTDPTATVSLISLTKGIIKQLQGTAAIVTKVDVEPSTLASTYFIKRTNITTASVNLAFGFTSKTIQIETGQSNDAEIAVSYLGGTAVAPAANTAGNDLVDAGRIITLDVATTSISVIAVGGTQTIYVRAWR